MSGVRFRLTRSDTLHVVQPHTQLPHAALARAWNEASARPGAIVYVSPVGRQPVLSLEWKKGRVDCRSQPAGRRLTYAAACDLLEKVPDAL